MGKNTSSGTKQNVVEKNTTEPWEGVQPHLQAIGGEAGNLYKSGTGPRYYPGATYIGPTNHELGGLNQQLGIASGPNALRDSTLGNVHGLFGSGGLTAEMRASMAPLFDVASGANKITLPGVGESNPHLMTALDTAAGKARESINGMFSAQGRLGGGAHQGVMGREIGDIYTKGLVGQMNTDLERQRAIESQNISNRMGATNEIQGLFGQGQSRLGEYTSMYPQLDSMRYGDAQKQIDIGAAQRSELQAELADNVNRFNAEQSRPWDQLMLYNNVVGGLGGMGSTQTSSVPQGSAISGLLGGAATGAGIGSALGPWGTFGGGIAGGIAGLFA